MELVDELHDVLDRLNSDKTARVVILKGEGKGFCSGADLLASGSGVGGRKWDGKNFTNQRHFSNLIRKMRGIDQPIIAAVHGAAWLVSFLRLLGSIQDSLTSPPPPSLAAAGPD